jgi:putative tricarboxylic transport membrane protein
MRFNDAIIGLVLLLFGGAVTIHSQMSFPGLPGQQYGPAFFPTILGVALAGCGILLIVQGIIKRREVPMMALGDWAFSSHHRVNFFLVMVALVFYILVSDWLGFIPTAFAVTTVLMLRFRVPIFPALGTSVASTLIIHSFFYKFMLVPLPWGLLQPIAW